MAYAGIADLDCEIAGTGRAATIKIASTTEVDHVVRVEHSLRDRRTADREPGKQAVVAVVRKETT